MKIAGIDAMDYPLVYELNTRCWLGDLAETSGRQLQLGEVPESEFLRWKQLGFTHIWLMGVWPSGPLARAQALSEPGQRLSYDRALPGWTPEDVSGSPYAISAYEAPADLGGTAGLQTFRRRLHDHGLKLLLDFVPNHLGVDHAWVHERPGLFIQSTQEAPEFFRVETADKNLWIAHGKDPYFPAWTDTAQLDYRLAETRRLMTEVLLDLAQICDGVRCDMAMLVLQEVISRTWNRFPPSGSPAEGEFWEPAIRQVKSANPGFLFLAEAYWGLERRLQVLGFDYTYDKALYDKLISEDALAVQRYLFGMNVEALARGTHFLENHDEPRAAALLDLPRHRAAALLFLALPGMRLLHEGQLSGARVRVPVQLRRRLVEPNDSAVEQFYGQFLTALKTSAVGRGDFRLLPARPDNSGCIFIQWQQQTATFELTAVNLTSQQQVCEVELPVSPETVAAGKWELLAPASFAEQPWRAPSRGGSRVVVEMPAYAAQLMRFLKGG